MEILGALPITFQEIQYVLIIMDRYSKLTRAIPTSKTTVSRLANLFLDHWIVPFGVPTYLLTDYVPKFGSKSFQSVSRKLGIKHLSATSYHPQTNGKAQRFNKIIVTCLRHYVVNINTTGTYSYNPLHTRTKNKVHKITNKSP